MSLSRLLAWLATLLVVATLALVGHMTSSEWWSLQSAVASQRAVDQLRQALLVAEMVSRERGPTNGALGDALPTKPALARELNLARGRSDRAFLALQAVLPPSSEAGQRAAAARAALAGARATVDRTLALQKPLRSPDAIRAAVYGMVAVVPLLAPISSDLTYEAQQAYPALGEVIQAARLSSELREYAGLLGSHFTAALAQQHPFSPEDLSAIEQTRGRIAQLRSMISLHMQMPNQPAAVRQAWQQVEHRYFAVAAQLIDQVIGQGTTEGRYGLDPAGFAALYVPEANTILGLRDVLLAQAMAEASTEKGRATLALAWVLAGSAALLATLGNTLLLVHRRVLGPLVQTSRALKALADDQLDAPLPKPAADDEMAAVIRAARALQVQTRERAALERERDTLITKLREQSNTDFLTHLPNRRAFIAAAEAVLAQAQRAGFGVAMVVLDLDRFKQLNDSYGHAIGDQALVAVANAVRSSLRLGDLAARYGGEEFVVLLSHCDRSRGLQLAERLREVIEATSIDGPAGTSVRVTASLGVADAATHGLLLDRLLSQADAAMYRAKQAGRNQVVVAELAA